jgi:hypothetical protein
MILMILEDHATEDLAIASTSMVHVRRLYKVLVGSYGVIVCTLGLLIVCLEMRYLKSRQCVVRSSRRYEASIQHFGELF